MNQPQSPVDGAVIVKPTSPTTSPGSPSTTAKKNRTRGPAVCCQRASRKPGFALGVGLGQPGNMACDFRIRLRLYISVQVGQDMLSDFNASADHHPLGPTTHT